MTRSNRVLFIGMIILVAAGLGTTAGCKGKSLSERIAEKAIETATGGKAKVDAGGESIKIKTKEGDVEYGAASKWPEDIPEDIPRFEAGTFEAASKMAGEGGSSWIMSVAGVDIEAVASYIQGLKDAGWAKAFERDDDAILGFHAHKDDKMFVNITYDKTESKLVLNCIVNAQ